MKYRSLSEDACLPFLAWVLIGLGKAKDDQAIRYLHNRLVELYSGYGIDAAEEGIEEGAQAFNEFVGYQGEITILDAIPEVIQAMKGVSQPVLQFSLKTLEGVAKLAGCDGQDQIGPFVLGIASQEWREPGRRADDLAALQMRLASERGSLYAGGEEPRWVKRGPHVACNLSVDQPPVFVPSSV